MHGFPDFWYSWRHQLSALAGAGFHAVAPDVRGFGETDVPIGAENYTAFDITGDLVGLINALGDERVRNKRICFVKYDCFVVFH